MKMAMTSSARRLLFVGLLGSAISVASCADALDLRSSVDAVAVASEDGSLTLSVPQEERGLAILEVPPGGLRAGTSVGVLTTEARAPEGWVAIGPAVVLRSQRALLSSATLTYERSLAGAERVALAIFSAESATPQLRDPLSSATDSGRLSFPLDKLTTVQLVYRP